MISRIGLVISRIFERTAPDPFVIAILLTLFTAIIALIFGNFPPNDQSLLERLEFILDSWRFDATRPAAERVGIWKLLEFSMQMCLILVTGHALAVTRPVRAMIDSVARLPRNTGTAGAMVAFIACATALINWGLGLIVGALLAREVGRSMQRRGITAHYPLIVAAGYMGLMVWHGGLSGSAPLSVTTPVNAAKVLPADAVALLGGGVPLTQTLFSPMNLFVSLGLLVITPLVFVMLAPKRREDMRTPASFGLEMQPQERMEPQMNADGGDKRESHLRPSLSLAGSLPDRLDRSWVIVWLLAIPLFLALVRFIEKNDWTALGLNEINATMLALGLLLHGSARSYMAAAEEGARGCAGIIIQFPLYGGIMAMMQGTGLVRIIVEAVTPIGNQTTVPLMSMFAGCIVNMFVPSGGAQWAVQGPVALEIGAQFGIAPAKMVMSVAYGDQVTNMLQPFWALPLLAITGVRARDIVGYCAIPMVFAFAWVVLGLLLF